ncbi:uncharacterized protein B0H18DRAFT_1126271 [Fomitopsis serialis]|uniref:uncharacterized protein n=1 Tax=Fomitopsis serialis TaxID=139415 RepID=UPI0020073470|nr:uncharacterized protein B0H18DRAFT_1126271 [Neoantrodia serialis]KAH9913408.1 hypothetical protein B0H18DRAFT_1126271 [Neoantrodia serialis]
MSESTPPNHYIIINWSVDVAPGGAINEHRQTLVGAMLSLFQGKLRAPCTKTPTSVAKSVDRMPITAQFYGLPELDRTSTTVKSVQITAADASTASFHVLQKCTSCAEDNLVRHCLS